MPVIFAAFDDAQADTAQEALAATPQIMRGFGAEKITPEFSVDAREFVGVNGNGLDTLDTMWGAVTAGKKVIERGAPIDSALLLIEQELVSRSRTALADTQRVVSSLSAKSEFWTAQYVRVLTPPSCGRCVVLAGVESGPTPFERHPNCDCTAAWSDRVPKGAYSTADDYLASLSDDQLAHTLGSQANAQAWRDGGDVNQLVNAYRKKGDVRAAQLYDARFKYTTEGTTKRGFASSRMIDSGYAKEFVKNGGRYTKVDRPRLMPESIYKVCGNDHDKAVDMLYKYGWILHR
jgi:hypothetical protein